ncbi:MAG TPA: metal-dependent transcriptional regulator [Solirubrobacterales bacterium]|nr:metal-dependent transcriptional regulator [Solirubrobacterales bacterium]
MSVEHAHATPAEEEYLQIIYWLMEAELPITGANIARAMQLSPPTVHEMVGRLEHDGYVKRNHDKSLVFTDSGREQAEAIVGRHRLIERFLTDVVGIAWDDVHEEAERLEHAMSPAFEAYMTRAVGDAKTCPHGHPISPGNRIPGVPLADVEVGADVEILRFENEAEDLLHYLKSAGLRPGLTGKLAESGDEEVVLKSNGTSVTVTRSVAETVSVKADPSPPPRTALPEQLVLGKDRYGR